MAAGVKRIEETGRSDAVRRIAERVPKGFSFVKDARDFASLLVEEGNTSYDVGPGTVSAQPLNLIGQFVSVAVPNIVSRNPTLSVLSKRGDHLRGYAKMLEMAGQRLIEDNDFVDVMRSLVTDAMYAPFAVCHTGLAPTGKKNVATGSGQRGPGQPYAERVSLDQFFIDPKARHPREAREMGHMFTMSGREVLESGMFPGFEDAIDDLASYARTEAAARTRDHTTGLDRHEEDPDGDQLWFTQVWVPSERRILIFGGVRSPEYVKPDIVLCDQEYHGPDDGPYDFLCLGTWHPDVMFPVSPTAFAYDAHRSANTMFRKVLEAADAKKDVVVASSDDKERLSEIRDAPHLALIGLQNPNAFSTQSVGGVNPDDIGSVEYFRNIAADLQGNSDMLSGTDSNAKTATEAQILATNTNVRVQDMRAKGYELSRRVVAKMLWFLHNTPGFTLPLHYRTKGGNEYEIEYNDSSKQGDFIDYNFQIAPDSMSPVMDAELRGQKVQQFIVNVLPVALQMAQQSQGAFKVGNFIEDQARFFGVENWRDYWSEDQMQRAIAAAAAQASAGAGGSGGGSSQGQMRKPGMPGSAGQGNSQSTGAGSVNFDTESNTAATMAAI